MEGKKYDNDKVPVGVILQQFPNALMAIAEVAKYGHNKYEVEDDWGNWKKVDNGEFRYMNAKARHNLQKGEDKLKLDDESKLPHVYHEAWNTLAELEFIIKRFNDERKNI